MPDGQRGELFDMTGEKCITADHETSRSQFRQLRERRIEVTFDAGVEDMKFKPEGFGAAKDTRTCCSARRSAGLTRSAMTRAVGSNSCSNSSRFGASSSPIGSHP